MKKKVIKTDGAPYPYKKVTNGVDDENKISSKFFVEANAISDLGEGKIKFTKPVSLTDTSEQHNGTKYDVKTMDITQWNLLLTADHIDKIQNIVGKVYGLKKVGNNRVTIDGIEFPVKQSALADFTYNMMLAGYVTDFSIETLGPYPDEEGIYYNSKLVGCSVVVQGNNKQAHLNKIATETIDRAKANGLEVASFEEMLNLPIDNEKKIVDNKLDMKFKTIKNSRGFAIVLKYKNSTDEEVETKIEPGKSVDVPDTEANKEVEKQVTDATEPKAPEAPAEPETPAAPAQGTSEEAITKAVTNAIAPLTAKIADLEKKQFDNGVKEPSFTAPNVTIINNKIGGMDYRARHGQQILHAWNYLKNGNTDAARSLNEINKYNLEELQKAGKVPNINPVTMNAITIADMGNFVISRELLTDIEGFRSNFGGLLGKLNFKDTLSTEMAWLTRSGDIDMEEVEFCDDDNDGNLKPVKEYGAEISTSKLNEIAAVTPVCNAATRFLAADLLGDVAEGYRTDWDRKKAQLFVARLQQAVNETGNVQHYNTNSSGGSDVNALKSIFAVGGMMQEDVMNGVFILSQASLWELRGRQAGAGINSDSGFKIFTTDPENGPLMFGAPYIVVPNELLPKLGSNQTRTFTVGGVSVTITSAMFYVDLNTFTGRTSGGLQYDLSTEAAYEVNGEVRSAYQRNELVLRGSGFRGGAVKDPNKVVGLEAVNLS